MSRLGFVEYCDCLYFVVFSWEEGGSTPVVSLEICPTDANFVSFIPIKD